MPHWISLIMAIGALSTANGLDSTGWARDRRNHAGLDGPVTVNMTLVPSVTNVAVFGEWEWAKGVPPCADNEINLRLPDDATDSSMLGGQFISFQSTVELAGFSFGANPSDALVLGVIFDGGGVYLNDPDDEHVPCLTAAPTLGPTMLPSTDPTSSPAGVPTTSPTQARNQADVGAVGASDGGADGSDLESGSVAAIVISLLVALAVMAVLLRRRQRELSANGADEPDVEDLAPSTAPASKLETITAGIAVPATSSAYPLASSASNHDAVYDTAEHAHPTALPTECDEHDLEIIPEDDTRPVPDGIGEINEAVQQQLQAKPLAQQPWFKSGFTRMQAEELLQDGYQGMFIVRESSQPGLFSVSVQAGNETFDHPSKITNMLCLPTQEANGETKFKLGDFGEAYFPTIPELIAYYQKKPYTRSEATGTLMYLKFFEVKGPRLQGDNVAASGKSSTEENNYSMPSAPEVMPSAPLDNIYLLASASGPDSSDDYDIAADVLRTLGTVATVSPGPLLRQSTFADDDVLEIKETEVAGALRQRSTSYGEAQADAVIEDEPADSLEPLFDEDTDTGATSEPALKVKESQGIAFSIGRFSKRISRSGGKNLVTPNIMAPAKRNIMEMCPEDEEVGDAAEGNDIIQFLGAVADDDGVDGAAGHAPADVPASYEPDDGPIKRQKSRLSLI